jgi:hypothetical protein
MKTCAIPEYGITVSFAGRCGAITSDLKKQLVDDNEAKEFQAIGEAQADALEALILAHAIAGIDIGSEEYKQGLKDALEAIANNS